MHRTLKDIIARRELVTATVTQSALDVARLMASKSVASVLIINEQQLEGIVTERDIITRVVVPGRQAETVKVTEIMTRHPVVMAADKLFSHALLAMADGGFRHLPVIDGGHAVGVVSIRDALGVEHEELDRLKNALDSIAGKKIP